MSKNRKDDIFDSLEEINKKKKQPARKPKSNIGSKTSPRKNAYTTNNAKTQTKRLAKKGKNSNTHFYGVTTVSVLIFLSLISYIIYFNAFKSAELVNNPKNVRQDLYAKNVTRGDILDKNGNVLARTVTDEEGNETREYPYGSLFAHSVGYSSDKGNIGVEASCSFDLLTSNTFFLNKIKNDIAGKKNPGDSVVTTLDVNVQEAAANALGDSKGAAIAIEPKTGNIIAMYSNPGFDPNSIDEAWDELNKDETNAPLLNRSINGLYSPGSIFKTITSLEYIREHSNYDAYKYLCEGEFNYEDISIHCYNDAVHGEEDLYSSFANSCNCSYANIGLDMDSESYCDLAKELLFNKKIYCPITNSKSIFKLKPNSSDGEKMMTAFGQGDTMVTPYHMALITCAIANKGVLNKPNIVSKINNNNGANVRTTKVSRYKKLMTSNEADILKTLMQGVVSYGTANELNDLPYSVAGKTGTAEYSSDKSLSHSWFMGFSNVEDPDLVVCVVVEDYDENYSKRSMPIARSMLEAYHNN